MSGETAPLSSDEPIGGEVRVGQGAPPAFMRWFNYGVWVAAILYLIVFWPDSSYHWTLPAFAVLMIGWLVYIFVGKRPSEP